MEGQNAVGAAAIRNTARTLPSFVIIGAMKSGTTSLAEYLMAHPEVYLPPRKEIGFFDSNWGRGVDWYREQFAGHGGEVARGEATPTYLSSPEAPARLAAVIPDAKLIAILRNPVDRAYSHYWHERHRKDRERRTFAQAVADELSVSQETLPDRYDPGHPGRFGYLSRGRYLPQLQRVCDHVPRESLLVLLLDDLEGEPVETFSAVCRFIGIDPSIVPENVGGVANAYVERRAARLGRFMSRHRLWRYMPGQTGRRLAEAMVRTEATYVPMASEIRLRLVEHFEASNAALAEWLGRDLSMWSRTVPPAEPRPRHRVDAGVEWWRKRR